jgi:acid phosphatase (class A)
MSLAALAAASCLAQLAVAQGIPAAPKAKAPAMLDAGDLDPALILPPPPEANSDQARRELAELHQIESSRLPERLAEARADSETKDVTVFREVLGPRFDLSRLPATSRLFAIVRATEKAEADRGKDEFRRPRPWIVDSALQSCSRNDEDNSSYPSGHATMAFSMAAILARLVPAKAGAIMARAARYGESRLVCEVHFRSDVTAGEALGLIVSERLMTKPAFRAAYDSARDELERASITPSFSRDA